MELMTERLRLREFVTDDWRRPGVPLDPRYQRFYELTEQTERAPVTSSPCFWPSSNRSRASSSSWPSRSKATGELIANFGARLKATKRREADIGELNPAFWGRRLCQRGGAMVEYGFNWACTASGRGALPTTWRRARGEAGHAPGGPAA